MTNKTYFRIFASCVPVKGYARSIIYDLKRADFHYIPNVLYDILEKCGRMTVEKIRQEYGGDEAVDSYFDFLTGNELGFYCEDPESYPDINFDYEVPHKITNAIVDLDKNSKTDIPNVLEQLDALGCLALQVRIYYGMDFSGIDQLIRRICETDIQHLEFITQYHSSLDDHRVFSGLLAKYPKLNQVYVHTSPTDRIFADDVYYRLKYTTTSIESSACCGAINLSNFSLNFSTFSESLKYNSCLNKKISVDVNGDIKNCPSMTGAFGNVALTRLADVLENENFLSYWAVNKNQISVCKDCEYRYMCTDCRAYLPEGSEKQMKPARCNYNPYTGQWIAN